MVCALHSGAQTFSPQYEAYVDSADRCIASEKWELAEGYLVKALREEPANKSNYILWANIGMLRANRGDDDGAISAYDIGLNIAPRSTTLLTNRAPSYLAKGKNKEAIEDLTLALDVDSTLVKARKLRGIALLSSKKLPEAIADFDVYESLAGKDAVVCQLRGDIAMLQNDSTGALGYYKESYELAPDPEAAVRLLYSAKAFGILDEYEDFLREAIKKFPRAGNLYLFRAMLNKARYQTEAMDSDLKLADSYGADPNLKELLK